MTTRRAQDGLDEDLVAQIGNPAWQAALSDYLGTLHSPAGLPEIQFRSEAAVDVTPIVDMFGFAQFCAMPENRKASYRLIAYERLTPEAEQSIRANFLVECRTNLLKMPASNPQRWALVYTLQEAGPVQEIGRLSSEGVHVTLFSRSPQSTTAQ